LGLVHIDFGHDVGVEECGNDVNLFDFIVMVCCEGENDSK
jgi:hypothetical protein